MNEGNSALANEASDNEKLRRAIVDIKAHIEQIEAILAGLGALASPDSDSEGGEAAATNDEIKDLLKKYSRL